MTLWRKLSGDKSGVKIVLLQTAMGKFPVI